MPYLAFIDEGIIWVVIIIGSIIVQVIKGAKKVQSNAPKRQQPPRYQEQGRREAPGRATQPPQPASAHRDRTEEIRQFFERIGEPLQEFVAPEPRRQRRPARKPPPAPRKATVVPSPILTPAPAPEPVTVTVAAKPKTSAQARALRTLLQEPQGQQQAILLREVLGPPLALRR